MAAVRGRGGCRLNSRPGREGWCLAPFGINISGVPVVTVAAAGPGGRGCAWRRPGTRVPGRVSWTGCRSGFRAWRAVRLASGSCG